MSRSVSAWIEFKGSLWEAPMGPSLCMDMKNCSLFIVHWKITKHSSTFFDNISQHQSGYFLVPLAPTPDQLVSQSVTRSFRLSLCHCLWDLYFLKGATFPHLTKKMPTYLYTLYTYLPNYLPTYFPLETINQTFDIFSVMRKHKMTKKPTYNVGWWDFCQMRLFQTRPSDRLLIGLLSATQPQYFRRHSIQFRQNHPRPISTNLWWSILLFQGTSNKRTILTLFVSNILKEMWHFGEMCPVLWNKQVNYWNCQNCFGFQLSI